MNFFAIIFVASIISIALGLSLPEPEGHEIEQHPHAGKREVAQDNINKRRIERKAAVGTISCTTVGGTSTCTSTRRRFDGDDDMSRRRIERKAVVGSISCTTVGATTTCSSARRRFDGDDDMSRRRIEREATQGEDFNDEDIIKRTD